MAKPEAVILAAGLSRRMGSNKLLLPLGDSTVLGQVLSRFPYELYERVILVWADPRVAAIAGPFPITLSQNDDPAAGKSRSIRLGLAATSPEHGVLFAVADQPLLSPATVHRLIDEFRAHPEAIVLPEVHGRSANPVIFPADLRAELARLQDDHGGREVLRRHPHRVRAVPFTDEAEFFDIDTFDRYQEVVAQWQPKD